MKALFRAYYSLFVSIKININVKTVTICFWALLIFPSYLWAQFQKPDASIPSPNAASLGLYGEVPVSLYTGVPNINIPIYTVKEGNLEVPIALNYHASGVRVNQHPGWVGSNWNLNAAGSITRHVKDLPDDLPIASNSPYGQGYINSHPRSLLSNPNWSTKQYFKETVIESNLNYLNDTEPDEFKFNWVHFKLSLCRHRIVKGLNLLSNQLPAVAHQAGT